MDDGGGMIDENHGSLLLVRPHCHWEYKLSTHFHCCSSPQLVQLSWWLLQP